MAEAIILTLGIGFVDFITGYEVSVFLFYSLPILMMVFLADKKSAVFVALLSAIVWWWADEKAGHPYLVDWYQAWEASVRLGFFLFIVAGGAALKNRVELLERSRCLELEILRISEREQQRIGQDLHDGLCQYYAAVGCAAGSLKRRLEACGVEQAKDAAEIADLIMKGVVQTRSLARGLFPVENDEAGLQSALQELGENTSRLHNLKCVFECEKDAPVSNNMCATHLFRIAQEALNNAIRHGKATEVIIRLNADDNGVVTLSLSDNGVGFPSVPPTGQQRGMGLNIMEYRARMIGGQFQITANDSGGTIVACSVQPGAQPE